MRGRICKSNTWDSMLANIMSLMLKKSGDKCQYLRGYRGQTQNEPATNGHFPALLTQLHGTNVLGPRFLKKWLTFTNEFQTGNIDLSFAVWI